MKSWIRSRRFLDSVLLLVVLYIILGLCALFLELALQVGNFELAESFQLSDGWWEEQWLVRNNKGLNETVYKIDKFHPLLGWTLKRNLNNVSLRLGIVNSNSQGIRGVKEYSVEKKEKMRILAIGDSFTFGECVDDDETFSAYLEQLIPNSEVINMGVHGYGNDQQLLRLKLEGLKFDPDVIVIGFVNVDIVRNKLSFRDYLKPKFILEDDELVVQDGHLISPKEFLLKSHFRILNYIKMFRDKMLEKRIEGKNLIITQKILEEMIVESKSINSKFIMVYLPIYPEVLSNASRPHELFERLCENDSIICIDPTNRIHNFLLNEKNSMEYFNCHYRPEIHKIIAEEINDSLINFNILNTES